MSKKKAVSLVLSIVLSVILIRYLLSQIETQDLSQTFLNIYYPALLAFMAISLIASILRAWRYKLLLLPHTIGNGNILLVTFIRNLFVDLFPARIGSLSYIYILNKKLNFSFEVATSTFVVGFIFDFLTLSPFLILSILAVGLGSSALSSFSVLVFSALFFLIIIFIIWKITPLSRIFLKICQILFKVFHVEEKKWTKLVIKKTHLTIESLNQIRGRRTYWPIFFVSLGIRLAKYGSLYVLLFALLRSHGFSFEDLSFWKIILGITGAELTGALPIKGIGGFGTWESGWALAFKLMSFEARFAIISGVGVHLITNLFEYILGIISILILALPFKKKTL